MLSNIFNSIKNEELAVLLKAVIDEKGLAVQSGQISSSSYCFVKMNLAKNCINTVYKKFLEKLKTDKLNHFIKKNSEIFSTFLDELISEVFEIITTDMTKTNSVEEYNFLDKTYNKPLRKMKSEILEQWNTEAVIQGHIKKQEIKRQFRNYMITFIIALFVTIIGLVLNSGTKPVQKVIEKEIQIIPSEVVEKVKNSPEARQKALHIFKIFEGLDATQLREFLRTLYLKFN